MWKWITVIVVIIVVVAVVANSGKKGVPVQTAVAQKGEISAYIEERARTTLPHVYHITMPLDCRIRPISLKEGATVSKGQVVAELDTTDLATVVTEAKSRVDAIQARIKVSLFDEIEQTALKESDSIIKSFGAAVQASGKKVEASKAREDYAKWWQESNEKMFKSDATSKRDLKLARMEAAEALVSYEADQFKHHAMETVYKTMHLMPVYVNQFLQRKELSREVLKEQLAEAEASLSRAKRDLARAKITSPVDGMVLKRHSSNERVLPAGAPLLDIGRVEDLEITADVLSQDAVDIKVGDPVDIYGAAIGPGQIHGQVARVKPEGFTKVSSLGVEQQRVAVVITPNAADLQSLKEQKRTLGVGYRVRTRIHTARSTDAVKIPRTVLFRGSGGTWQAFAVRDGKACLLTLKVGLCNDREAEVVDGTQAGDVLIVAPAASLSDGTTVKGM